MSLQDTSDNLVGLYSVDFWEVLLKATTIRQHEAALKVASSLPEQFVIFKPLRYCFKETIGFDVKASFASRP